MKVGDFRLTEVPYWCALESEDALLYINEISC